MKRSLLLAAGITAAIAIPAAAQAFWWGGDKKADAPAVFKLNGACLLYTSDAADE